LQRCGPIATTSSPSTARPSRRTHDKRKGLKALHTLSAYATNARLTLAQRSVPEKTNEITAIPDLLDQLAEAKQLKGALVTIDVVGCQVEVADRIVGHGADYLLALKGNQPTLESDVEANPSNGAFHGIFPSGPLGSGTARGAASLRVSTDVTTTAEDSSVRCTGRLFTISTTFARNSSLISVSTLMTRETSQIA